MVVCKTKMFFIWSEFTTKYWGEISEMEAAAAFVTTYETRGIKISGVTVPFTMCLCTK